MSELGKPFLKKSDPKKNKINIKMPNVNKTQQARNGNIVQTKN